MNFSKKLMLTAVACLAPMIGHAAPVSSGTNLSVGGLNFSNFGCTVNSTGLATPTACSQIGVNTITQPGVGISFTSGFTAIGLPLSFSDAVLSYNVSSAMGISSVGMDFNGFFAGLAVTSVTESIYNGSDLVGFAKVSCGVTGGCTRTTDIALNGIYNNLFVKKDINVTAFAGGLAQASYIDQTFTAAPEPGSTALMGAGLLGLAGLMRRSLFSKFAKKQA